MREPSHGVPGWLTLRRVEATRRLYEQIEVSPKVWDAYEERTHPLPTPSVRYDVGSVLYVAPPPSGTMMATVDPGEERPDFERLNEDFYARALDALRSLTEPDEFIFALDCEYEGYLFWPHKAVPGEPWPLRVPGPEAYFSLFARADYSWGFFRSWYAVDVFGQPLLDAFERNRPEILSKVTAVDGVELPTEPLTELEEKRLERQLAEDRVAQILFRTELNYAVCPEGPWSDELEHLHAEFERTGHRDDLVRLIVKIEQILDDRGIEHTPCVTLDDDDS